MPGIGGKLLQRLYAVVREYELVAAAPDVPPHALEHQRLKVGFVVDYENLVGHWQRTPRRALSSGRPCGLAADGRGRLG